MSGLGYLIDVERVSNKSYEATLALNTTSERPQKITLSVIPNMFAPQVTRSGAKCADILHTGTVWNADAKGFLLGDYTNQELQFIGCMDNGCSPGSVFCTDSSRPGESITFGTNSNEVMRACHGVDFVSSCVSAGCCTIAGGLCNAPDTSESATELCRALGYSTGSVLMKSDNACPETHWDGHSWTSDFIRSNGAGSSYMCTEPSLSSSSLDAVSVGSFEWNIREERTWSIKENYESYIFASDLSNEPDIISGEYSVTHTLDGGLLYNASRGFGWECVDARTNLMSVVTEGNETFFDRDESCRPFVECIQGRDGNTWTRTYTPDVPFTESGLNACKTKCTNRGFDYFGFECPHGHETHCQCANEGYKASRKVATSAFCAGSAGVRHGHCVGPYVMFDTFLLTSKFIQSTRRPVVSIYSFTQYH